MKPSIVASERPSAAYERDGYHRVVVGYSSMVLVTKGGSCVTVGDGWDAALATGSAEPVLVNVGGRRVRDAACGRMHSLFLTQGDDRIWANGSNERGVFGFDESESDSAPERPDQPLPMRPGVLLVGDAARVVQVAAGSFHSLFLCVGGECFACGAGRIGQLGCGDTPGLQATPRRVLVDEPLRRVFAGGNCSGFVQRDTSELRMCGSNCYAALGIGHTREDLLIPCAPAVRLFVEDAATSGEHTMVVTRGDAQVWAFGSNGHGRCGLRDERTSFGANRVLRPRRVPLVATARPVHVSLGTACSTVLLANGTLVGCGSNRYGQLLTACAIGDEAHDFRSVVLDGDFAHNRIVDVSSCDYSTTVLLDTGHCVSFGSNLEGQRGLADRGTGFARPSLVPAVWHVRSWRPGLVPLSAYSPRFVELVRLVLLVWRRESHKCWRRGRGFFALRLVFDLLSHLSCGVEWDVTDTTAVKATEGRVGVLQPEVMMEQKGG